MSNTIKAGEFGDALNDLLTRYGDEARNAIQEEVIDIAKEASKKLRSAGSFNGKKYRKGWTAKVDNKRVSIKAVAYNKNHYQLTHLLEFGHAKRNGGRTKAFEHISPVNDWAQNELVKRIKERLDNEF